MQRATMDEVASLAAECHRRPLQCLRTAGQHSFAGLTRAQRGRLRSDIAASIIRHIIRLHVDEVTAEIEAAVVGQRCQGCRSDGGGHVTLGVVRRPHQVRRGVVARPYVGDAILTDACTQTPLSILCATSRPRCGRQLHPRAAPLRVSASLYLSNGWGGLICGAWDGRAMLGWREAMAPITPCTTAVRTAMALSATTLASAAAVTGTTPVTVTPA